MREGTLNIPALLKEHGIKPRKSLGQNFLVDPYALRKIVEAAEITKETTVLEIGPGLGSLTRLLASESKSVVAVELDDALIPILQKNIAPYKNVQIIYGDILKVNPADLVEEQGYIVVGNIPYYITSAVIRHLLESGKKPARLVLTVQQEVARRICASPGDYSLLALSVQVYGQPHLTVRIPAGAFYPAPKVDSITVRVDLYSHPLIPEQQINNFFELARAGFSQKRKTLRNALAGGLGWSGSKAARIIDLAGIEPNRRAETLNLKEWGALTEIYMREMITETNN